MAKKKQNLKEDDVDDDLDVADDDVKIENDEEADDEIVAEEEEEEGEPDDEELEKNLEKDLAAIEKKLEKGEELESSAGEISVLLKSRSVYYCPRCRRIYFRNKWVKDNITDMYLVRTELSLCDKCMKVSDEYFISTLEIFDKDLAGKRKAIEKLARTVQNKLENRPAFEKVIDIIERKGILYIFSNSTRLSMEISRELRAEWHGTVQYEWFERNQYLRARWYANFQERAEFAEQIRNARSNRFGMFSFEDRM